MNTGGEAAEQVVRMSLETGEVALKITGQAAKHLAVMLYAVLKDQKRTKGRVRLESLCRNSREVKVFTVRKEDVGTFVRRARDYGLLYCAVRGQKDGMVDFMVRLEDASKADRIVERFRLASVEEKDVKLEVEHPKRKRGRVSREQRGAARKDKTSKAEKEPETREDALLEELLGGQEERKKDPLRAGAEKPRPSAPISGTPKKEGGISKEQERKRPSVKRQLQEIQKERQASQEGSRMRQAERSSAAHHQPGRRKKNRGQRVR